MIDDIPRHRIHSYLQKRPNSSTPEYHPVTKQPRRWQDEDVIYPRNTYNVEPPADPWKNECFWPDSLLGIDPRPRPKESFVANKVPGRFEHGALMRLRAALPRGKTSQDLSEETLTNQAHDELRYQAHQGVKRREQAKKRVQKALVRAFHTECVDCGSKRSCRCHLAGQECWRRPVVERAKQDAIEKEAKRELKPAMKAAKAVAAVVDKAPWSDECKTDWKEAWAVREEEVKAGKISEEWAELEDEAVKELYEKHRRPASPKAGPSTRPKSAGSGSSWESLEKVMEVEW